MPVASKRPFMNKEADNEIYSEMGQSAKVPRKQIRTKEEFNINPLFMLTKVIKLSVIPIFCGLMHRYSVEMYFRPVLGAERPPAESPGTAALVAEYPQHRAVGLLLGEEPRIIFVVALVAVDDDVLGHQAVRLQAALLHQFLALILTQQLLQHVEAHPLLDAAAGLGSKST